MEEFNRPAESQRMGETPRKSGGMHARSAPHSYGMLQWASLYDLRHRTKRQIVKDPMMSDANKYHRQAEECRRNSESALRPIDREAWLRLAADYAKLAEGAELTQRLQD